MSAEEAETVEGSGVEEPEVPQAPLEKFSVPVLKIIKEAQGLHGLRYGDFQRYRQYCGRRMRRLRKGLKFLHWEQGKGKSKFQAKEISVETAIDVRFLLIMLNKAERAWSYAMQLREQPGGPGREVHHVQRLLAKAVKHAAKLEELCKERADDRSALEAEAYSAWLSGSKCLESEKWEDALSKLSRCRTVYDELSKAAEGPDQELYSQMVQEIDPSVRYCNFNVSREGGGNLEADSHELMEMAKSKGTGADMLKHKLEKTLAQTRKKQAEGNHQISWLGSSISVSSADIYQQILAAQDNQKELAEIESIEGKLEVYDKLFMALEDAKGLIRDEISENLKKGNDCDENEISALQSVRNYVQSLVLLSTRERDLLLVSQVQEKLISGKETGRKAARPENLVKMFETLQERTEEYGQIPGIADDASLGKLVAARSLMFKAWRILYLAASYKNQKQFPEALALAERSQQLEKVARTRFTESKSMDEVDKQWLDLLFTMARQAKTDAHAAAILAQTADTTETPSESVKQLAATPLSTRLNNYEAAVYGDVGKVPKLVEFPPPIESVACKPVLFDLALNKAVYPDISARTKKKATGIMGWFSRK